MSEIIERVCGKLSAINYVFEKPPIIIGGMAMEYYGIRKSGADIDLVICDADYQNLAQAHSEKRKDIYGDFGVVIEPFEIWRSIALLDFDFFSKDAIDFGDIKMVSIDRLLFSRVSAMEVQKYLDDLILIKEYYYKNYRNKDFLQEAETHIPSYEKTGGIVWGGNYQDLNIKYRQLNIDDIHPDILNDFNRYQEVTKCWRKQNGEWVLVDNHFTENWDNEKKVRIASAFPIVLNSGGTLIGVYDKEKLIAFALLKNEKLGKAKQYIQLEYLLVSYEYRRMGIGKKLFALCVDAAMITDAKKLYISANSSQESQAFYRAIKCVEAEEIIPELFEDEPFDVHMEYVLSEKEGSI
jgi:ribosomal protein S18 acetylase RimI-like enzyme